MKKFLVFVLLVVGGYFVYDNFIKEKIPYELNDSFSKHRESADLDNPSIQPRTFACYEGTIKNISDQALTNIVINYIIDAQPVSAKIDKLEPGEVKNYKTGSTMLMHMDAAYHLDKVTYSRE